MHLTVINSLQLVFLGFFCRGSGTRV
jgi:hypothetical protein